MHAQGATLPRVPRCPAGTHRSRSRCSRPCALNAPVQTGGQDCVGGHGRVHALLSEADQPGAACGRGAPRPVQGCQPRVQAGKAELLRSLCAVVFWACSRQVAAGLLKSAACFIREGWRADGWEVALFGAGGGAAAASTLLLCSRACCAGSCPPASPFRRPAQCCLLRAAGARADAMAAPPAPLLQVPWQKIERERQNRDRTAAEAEKRARQVGSVHCALCIESWAGGQAGCIVSWAGGQTGCIASCAAAAQLGCAGCSGRRW